MPDPEEDGPSLVLQSANSSIVLCNDDLRIRYPRCLDLEQAPRTLNLGGKVTNV